MNKETIIVFYNYASVNGSFIYASISTVVGIKDSEVYIYGFLGCG